MWYLVVVLCVILIIFIDSSPIYNLDLDRCHDWWVKEWPVTIMESVVPRDKCMEIIECAEKNSWAKDRHEAYPTTDQLFYPWFKNYNFIEKIVQDKIFEKISEVFKVSKKDLHISEMFVVKYRPSHQDRLAMHQDGNEFSFVMALNDEYVGGGTRFVKSNKYTDLSIGDVAVFSGKEFHEGMPVRKGTRYILTGFISYRHHEFCADKLRFEDSAFFDELNSYYKLRKTQR